MKLLYPTAELKEVDVGIVKIKTLKVYEDVSFVHDGSLSARICASVCNVVDHKPFLNISAIDGLRLIRQARANSNRYYTPKYVHCTCGKVVFAQPVDLTKDVEAGDLYNNVHEFQGFKIKLKPETLKDELSQWVSITLNKGKGLTDLVFKSRIQSVNDNENFVLDELPVELIEWLEKLVEGEADKYLSLSMLQCEPCSCGLTMTKKYGLYDQNFVLNR